MKTDQAIRSILNDEKFEAVLSIANELVTQWNEGGNMKKETIEQTVMNTLTSHGKVQGLTEFLERLKDIATASLKTDNE